MRKLDIIKNYYGQKLQENLPDFQTLGWESQKAQFDRFRILTDNIELNNHKILDVGCGLGNLLEHLKEVHETPDYTGVDILEEMVAKARIRHPGYKFFHTDLFVENRFSKGEFHTIYSSGIFNINMGNNHDFLKDAIKQFLYLTRQYVLFNLLHYNSPDRDDTYYYFHPDEVVKMIEDINDENLKSIKIIEHYLQNDFTVILEKK